ncbi:MAG: dicarboxylate/amino acid:cation symporter [Thermoanaerobacteraceae bacterium]|nr:dicarboxylate/amino acid:cation symporter [Thermoanaerobacteraceae bacterium]
MKFSTKILLGMIAGVIFGAFLSIVVPDWVEPLSTYILGPVGQIFIRAIKMLVVPLVFVSLVSGAAGIGDPKKMGRVGIKTVFFYMITTMLAITVGLTLANIFDPGVGFTLPADASFKVKEAPSIVDTLVNMVPTNPIKAMVEQEMLQIIVFALLCGIGLALMGERGKTVLKIVDDLNHLMIEIVHMIMKLAPYGVFALIAVAVGEQGIELLKPMLKYMFVVLGALAVHASVNYSILVRLLGGLNPVKFFKGIFPAMAVAFSTSSSSATLPVTIETCEENLDVPKEIGSFVLPLGATINMDGTAIMQGVAAVFIAQVYGVDLTMGQQLTILLTATLASVGTAGVPGVGLITLSMVLQSVGLPVAGIALIIGVDRLLDMCRTAINISGDALVSVIITNSEMKHDSAQASTGISGEFEVLETK